MDREGSFTPTSVAAAAGRAIEAAELQPSTEGPRVRHLENFDAWSTHIPGFEVLTDIGGNIDHLTVGQIERLHELGGPYVQRALVIKALEKKQKNPGKGQAISPHDELEAYATVHGIRGGLDEGIGWQVQLNPQTSHEFNPDLVERSGERAAEHVHRSVVFTLTLDPEKHDVAEFLDFLRRGMKRRSIAQDALSTSKQARVDEEDLIEGEESGEFVLLPGAHIIKITRHNVVPSAVPTIEERERISEAVQADDLPSESN